MTKKNYGLRFSTDGRTVNIDMNEKLIKKAGNIKIYLDDTNTAHFTLSDWTIAGTRRFKRLRRTFGKSYSGIEIDGENTSIVIQGEKNNV